MSTSGETSDVVTMPSQAPFGLCLACNAPLTDPDEQECPQCGQPVDAAVPATFNHTMKPTTAIQRIGLRSSLWPMLIVAVIGGLVIAWILRLPQFAYDPLLVFTVVGLFGVLMIVRVIQLVWRSELEKRLGLEGQPLAPIVPAAPVMVGIAAVLALAITQQWPLRAALALSEDTLMTALNLAAAEREKLDRVGQYGLYYVHAMAPIGDAVLVLTEAPPPAEDPMEWLDTAVGFAYFAPQLVDADPILIEHVQMEPINDGWYAVTPLNGETEAGDETPTFEPSPNMLDP